MLLDSAHIQESDANWENQKGKRAGKEPVEPLYTIQDAQATLELLVPAEYGERVSIHDDVALEFVDAGHLLGSAEAQLWLTEGGVTRKIVFSGDLGNTDQPIIRDPQPVDGSADFVVTESTYGDRLHGKMASYKEELARLWGRGVTSSSPPSPWAAPRSFYISFVRSRRRGW
jgi:metallo-beta-lactamase family protein